MRTRALGIVLGVTLCVAGSVFAQQGTSEIGGKVIDQQGGVLPGVAIVITNEDTGVFREVASNPDGSYFISQVIPGRYRITAKMEGFRSLERRGVVIEVGRTQTLDLTLDVGALAETITVSGDSPLVDLSSAEVGGHISAQELAELPSGSRSYMAFVGNVPGAVFVPAAGFLNDTMLANGQPAAANNVSFDGSSNIDDLRGSNVGGQARAANETVQEVQVITNQFDAEYGRASGAVINAVTKSGTNQLSGSVFDFFTGKGVTAKDYFTRVDNRDKPDVGKTEWGATVGGPIVQNKLFFFGSLERVAQSRNQSATFPDPRANFSYSNTDDVSAWNTFWRVDHQVNANNTWAFRHLREYAPQFFVMSGNETPQSHDDETDLDQTAVATWTTVVSNTKVNTFRFGGTFESTVHSNPGARELDGGYGRCVPCGDGILTGQALLAPRLQYLSLNIQADDTADFSLDNSYSFEDTFSWFVPDKLGRHDNKFGAKYTRIWISNPNNSQANGSYVFGHNLPFNAADPRTYPERLNIRVPGMLEYELISHIWELYVQDKWQVRNGLTLSLGVRYDLEVMPIDETGNPLFPDPTKYPVDRNNLAPRLGMVWNPDGQGKSVVRAGYGMFYDRTLLGTVDNFLFDTKYASSFIAPFPQNAADPGPSTGQFPTDPTLLTPTVSQLTPAVRAFINAAYPPGAVRRNTDTVTWDDPERTQPYFHQISGGYEREVLPGLSVSADYIRMMGRDMFLNPNLNIGSRINTSRTGRIEYRDPFGTLNASLSPGEPAYVSTVRLITTKYGYTDYDALNLSVEKRYANLWSLRGAYSIGYSRGVAAGQGDTPQLQVGTDLNLDEYEAPAGVDRRHNVAISGRMEIPKTRGVNVSGMLRMLSGTPFTIHDTNFDVNQNGVLFDPLPAGTYSGTAPGSLQNVENKGGRNGARGPGFMQLDLRFGYRARLGSRRTLDVFSDVFNVTNHANFVNPSGDRRNTADFLRLSGLVATSGLPRQAQLGIRLGF